MEVFEIFIIRYINYINIWSIELTRENFYEEFRDGILLVNLLKQWSSLYGYNNTEGDLVIYKRPLNRSQALGNIHSCLNFILNPPEKSKLPEYLNGGNELIKSEEVYDMNVNSVIRFISTVFHHYLIPYLRINSKIILNNMDKYLRLHGLSLSDETIQNFYKMIMKKNSNQIEDELLLERIESWEEYLSLNFKEIENQERMNINNENQQNTEFFELKNSNFIKFEHKTENKNDHDKYFVPKYINPLQCDITSNGFMLIMIMLYQMGWIDTAVLCQMYYVPKTLEEFKWNHEIVYYSFQTINKYLNIQKELSIVNHHSSSTTFENHFLTNENEYDDDEDHEVKNNITNSEIPFVLVPLSSLYMESFSPYVLLLQIEILYNLLTQQIDSNYDVTTYSSNRLAVYGPYQPINLELLDELTYKDNYPLNWTIGNCESNFSSKDSIQGLKEEEYEIEKHEYIQRGNIEQDNDLSLNLNKSKNQNSRNKNNSAVYSDNLTKIEVLINGSNKTNIRDELEEEQDNNINNRYNDDDDDYVVGSMYEYLQDKEKEINEDNRNANNLYMNSVEQGSEYDIGYNYDGNNKSVQINEQIENNINNKISQQVEEATGMDEMFNGLEKELEILKIYDKNNFNENHPKNEVNNTKNITQIFQEKMMSNTREFREQFSHILTKEENGRQNKVKPLISRTALEEQQKKILGMVNEDDDFNSKVFDITRKQSDGVIEKISTAISENNKLLEKLKMSMNINNHHHHHSQTENKLENSKENSKENNNQVNHEVNKEISQKSINNSTTLSHKSNLKNTLNSSIQKNSKKKKVNKVSFSDLVKMEVERTSMKS